MTIVVPSSTSQSAANTANFDSLSKSIAKWLNRTDLTDVIPDFVRMAEAEFTRDTRIRSSFQVVIKSDYSVSGEIALPSDLLELRQLEYASHIMTELPLSTWQAKLRGNYYARIGEVLHITGKPKGAYTLTYLQKLPQLVFNSDSNWLLREHYDVYLWKCCELGSAWMRDVDGVSSYNQKYEAAVQSLLEANNYHSSGSFDMTVQAPGVV